MNERQKDLIISYNPISQMYRLIGKPREVLFESYSLYEVQEFRRAFLDENPDDPT